MHAVSSSVYEYWYLIALMLQINSDGENVWYVEGDNAVISSVS